MWLDGMGFRQKGSGKESCRAVVCLGRTLAHFPPCGSGMGAATQPGASFGARSLIAHFLQVGGVYSYDCSFGHVPNVELMKFIAMATFGSYLSTCPEPEPGNLGLTVYHRAFLLYSFLRSGEALNPEYYCGECRLGQLWERGNIMWT